MKSYKFLLLASDRLVFEGKLGYEFNYVGYLLLLDVSYNHPIYPLIKSYLSLDTEHSRIIATYLVMLNFPTI